MQSPIFCRFMRLSVRSKDLDGLVFTGAGCLYVWLSRRVRARNLEPDVSRTLQLLHIAVAVGLLTIAIPIGLNAHWITIGWFVDSAALLWVAQRIKSDFLDAFALVALVLGVVRLLLFDNFESGQLIIICAWEPTQWPLLYWAWLPGMPPAARMKPRNESPHWR